MTESTKNSSSLCITSELSTKENDNNSNSQNSIGMKKECGRSKLRKTKSVSFADNAGSELTQVKIIPSSNNLWPSSQNSRLNIPKISYTLNFQQLYNDIPRITQILQQQAVCLENLIITESKTIRGTVQVSNLAFEKDVKIRFTIDNWDNFEESTAIFLRSLSKNIDIFSFDILLKDNLISGHVKFCIRFVCNGCEFWDNNFNKNYCVFFH